MVPDVVYEISTQAYRNSRKQCGSRRAKAYKPELQPTDFCAQRKDEKQQNKWLCAKKMQHSPDKAEVCPEGFAGLTTSGDSDDRQYEAGAKY